MKKTKDQTRQELRDAFQYLYDQLSDAYWQASTIEDKDRIRGLQYTIFNIITELNREDIIQRTSDFQKLKEKVDNANIRLGKLKKTIDDIIHTVELATSITQAIDTAVSLAAKFFV